MNPYNINITTTDIVDNINRLTIVVREPNLSETLKLYEKNQLSNEEKLVAESQICGKDKLKDIRERISGLHPEKLEEDVNNNFYDANVMKAVQCTIDSVIYAPTNSTGSDYHNDKIKEYIQNLHQIGAESINGYAFLGDFDGIKNFFVEKVAQNPLNDLLIHELVVGLYGTNKLREFIPNFSYIYGGFKCSPPIIDPETKKIASWCLDNENTVNYVLYENVAPAISVYDYVDNCSASEFLNVYMQVLYSLRLAHKMIDYTHYDLHGENVLVRTPKNTTGQFQIDYDTEKGKEYITSDVVSTFIDYGSSHIKTEDIIDQNKGIILKGQDFGVHGLIPYSIYPNRSFILYDAYRLLISCMGRAYDKHNDDVLNEGIKILKFFNTVEDPITVINSSNSSILPLIEKVEKLSLDDLITHIRSVCNCDFIGDRNDLPILDCEMSCPTEEAIFDNIGISDELPVPTNILEFYDQFILLNKQERFDEADKILDEFDYDNAISKHIKMIDEQATVITNKISQFNNTDKFILEGIPYEELFTFDVMTAYKNSYVNIGEIIDLISKYDHYVGIGTDVATIYDDQEMIEEINSILDVTDLLIFPFFDEVIVIIDTNANYLASIPNDIANNVVARGGGFINVNGVQVKQDERLRWYFEGRLIFDNSFIKSISEPVNDSVSGSVSQFVE